MEDATKMEIPATTNKPKRLKVNNEWDANGLRGARNENDSEEILCSKTEKPLYYIREDGYKTMLDSFGVCYNCENVFHASKLKFADSMAPCSWPIEYIGRWCVDCSKLSINEWEENLVPRMKGAGVGEFRGETKESELKETPVQELLEKTISSSLDALKDEFKELEEEHIEALDDDDEDDE